MSTETSSSKARRLRFDFNMIKPRRRRIMSKTSKMKQCCVLEFLPPLTTKYRIHCDPSETEDQANCFYILRNTFGL